MTDEFTQSDWDKLQFLFNERARWANLQVSIKEIVKDNKLLITDLSRYDSTFAIPLLASLLTLPKLQSNCIRLEILVVLAVLYCQGRKKLHIADAVRWFSQIGKSQCVLGEDQAEDVFVSLVQGRSGDYRLLEGVWEAAGFYTQKVLDVITRMPDTEPFGQIKRSVHALLVISDMVCENAGLHRYQLGSDERYSMISPSILPGRNALLSRVSLSFADLEAHGITPDDIAPFCLQAHMLSELHSQQIGDNHLDRCPVIVHDKTHLTVALPPALSVAIRDYVIGRMIECGLAETFDDVLAQNYSKLFFETPLLGGPTHAPVFWRKIGEHRWTNFSSKIDEGYFISFHLFLPTVKVHPFGGFKNHFEDDGTLTKVLQISINEVVKHFDGQDDFKKGLVVIVGCGWGKGYSTQDFELNHPHWRFESMSAADLVRLSWLGDMTPSYFWRIQDGLEAVNKAGVEIVNPNGIINLIGWVRSNDGHFVPHEHLPEGEISPERPLLLNPPLNLLRKVRAEADHGFDRHCAVDNTGTWHNVQHVSPKPLFSSESAKRVYASMEDVRNGKLTAVYEGKIKLWVTVISPNFTEREVGSRLLEMATEWLHRIGNVLDRRVKEETAGCILKVYVEFHDCDQVRGGWKPSFEDLVLLCIIEPHSEPNACRAVFKAGFLAGARIPENITERIFVRTLTRAYLQLLGVEDCDGEAETVEALVVPNDNARSFHLFHAQHYMDYVRDTLPKELITIDPLDDAAAKISLGWRVLGENQSNNIRGNEACTGFLEKVVETLLSEIAQILKLFNRHSTLMRLVANSEKAYDEKYHWKRTSAAILGLHGDEPGTVDRYVEKVSKFTGADIASRILIEIALCECPAEGGVQISDIELSKLIVRAALVVKFGGLSDAIYYNALAPELTISPLGDILFRDELGRLVVEPMVARVMGEQFVAEAPLQRKNYEDPGIVLEAKGKISNEFWEIWNIEMGFNLDEARNIIDALEDKGVEDHAAIFTIKQSLFLSLVSSDKVTEDVARRFLDQFSLITRKCWNKPPKGFCLKDIYPWCFGRRLSFVSRPILVIDNSDDPLLIVAPGALRKGFAYILGGAYNGELEQAFFRTTEMRNIWLGKAHEGHTFNAEVAKALSGAGWQVRENIGFPEILNRKIEQDYGDIDVLAWRPDRKEVLVVECKNLSFARNYSEVAALLSDYQGACSEGRPDKLRRHLNRVDLLQDNLEILQSFIGVNEPRIVSCLVCSGVVPMQYAKIDALADTIVGGVAEIIGL